MVKFSIERHPSPNSKSYTTAHGDDACYSIKLEIIKRECTLLSKKQSNSKKWNNFSLKLLIVKEAWIDAVDFVDGVEMHLQLFEKWGSCEINLRCSSELLKHCLELIIFMFFGSFWCVNVKNNFLKIIIKYYFNIFSSIKI